MPPFIGGRSSSIKANLIYNPSLIENSLNNYRRYFLIRVALAGELYANLVMEMTQFDSSMIRLIKIL